MENYDRTMELVDAAYDSSGKSAVQFAKYQDTIEYKLKSLSSAWETFRVNFLNSDFYAGVIDLLTNLVDKLNELDFGELLGLAGTFLTVGKTAGTNFIKGFSGIANSIVGKIYGAEETGTTSLEGEETGKTSIS